VIVYTYQCNTASKKRKTTGFRNEEELADAVNEIVNDSDSDTDNIPEFSSSEDSESESANKSDNESNISILGPSRTQIDVTPTTGFSKNDRQPRTPPFIGNPGVQFAIENEADVMSYFDHYIPPELIEIVDDQTNLYAQQQIVKMPRLVTKHACSEEWKPVTVIKMKKFLGLIFVNSHKSFLDFMSDITENLIHASDAVSSLSSSSDKLQGSSRTPAPTPTKRAPINDPPGRLDGKLKNHKLLHIPPTKNYKTPTRKCRVCVQKNIKKETRFLCAQCGVPLHPEGCYTRYHTLKHY